MRMLPGGSLVFLPGLAAFFLSSCGFGGAEAPPLTQVEEIAPPSPDGSQYPNLFADRDGRIFMSWLESLDGSEHALRFSLWDGAAWSPAQTIHEGDDFWVNWADFSSVVPFADGSLAAHWLSRSGEGTYDYDVRITRSLDGGATWSESVVPHRDGTLAEHGFVSFFPSSDGGFGAVWLDGRDVAAARRESRRPEMTLRHTTLGTDGELGDEVLLDARVCDCCQTSAAMTSEGPIVVYRDRSEEEVRDISVVRRTAAGWTDPRPVHRDGWVIDACPVNGPQVVADGERVAVAWFTGADDTPRVRVALSQDAGANFGEPVQVDDGRPLGRVAVATLPAGDALVSWLEETDNGAEVRVRRVGEAGAAGRSMTIAESDPARASGFPRMVRSGETIVFAWTDPAESPRVRLATATLEGS